MSYPFTFTPEIVRLLQTIERIREQVRLTVLPPMLAERLRFQAHVRSSHYSTRIEGNRLTLDEAGQVIQQGRSFAGRERDVQEVARYYQALQQMETWVEHDTRITEARIRKLHALLYHGGRARPTAYRDGQNVIREAGGEIVYLPPEAKDVPELMSDLVAWIGEDSELPIPVIAGMAHYQFETIHPFFDGNGRTGRLLTTWILYQGGYDLGRFYSLEEFHAQDLQGYYRALMTHPQHNYYFGRHAADCTSWLVYFLRGMVAVFERVGVELESYAAGEVEDPARELLRPLDHRARRVLGHFSRQKYLRSSDVAQVLSISKRQARDVLGEWVSQGWLEIADPSKRGRKYRLAEEYQQVLQGSGLS